MAVKKITWDIEAAEELRSIYDYIFSLSPSGAYRIRELIFKATKDIGVLKLDHMFDPDLGPPYRRKVVERYQIIYRVKAENEILVVQILDSRQRPGRKINR